MLISSTFSDILTKKYSMKAIPETRGEHQIRYLGFRIIRLLIISLVSSTFLTFLFILLRIGECPSNSPFLKYNGAEAP